MLPNENGLSKSSNHFFRGMWKELLIEFEGIKLLFCKRIFEGFMKLIGGIKWKRVLKKFRIMCKALPVVYGLRNTKSFEVLFEINLLILYGREIDSQK